MILFVGQYLSLEKIVRLSELPEQSSLESIYDIFLVIRAKRVLSGRDVRVGSSAKWLQITGAPAKRGRNGSSLKGVQLSLG